MWNTSVYVLLCLCGLRFFFLDYSFKYDEPARLDFCKDFTHNEICYYWTYLSNLIFQYFGIFFPFVYSFGMFYVGFNIYNILKSVFDKFHQKLNEHINNLYVPLNIEPREPRVREFITEASTSQSGLPNRNDVEDSESSDNSSHSSFDDSDFNVVHAGRIPHRVPPEMDAQINAHLAARGLVVTDHFDPKRIKGINLGLSRLEDYDPNYLVPKGKIELEGSSKELFVTLSLGDYMRHLMRKTYTELPFSVRYTMYSPKYGQVAFVLKDNGTELFHLAGTFTSKLEVQCVLDHVVPTFARHDHDFPYIIGEGRVLTTHNEIVITPYSNVSRYDAYSEFLNCPLGVELLSAAETNRRWMCDNMKFVSYFDPIDGVRESDCIPVFHGDEMRLLSVSSHKNVSAKWAEQYYPSELSMAAKAGLAYCAFSYPFPEVPVNRNLLSRENIIQLFAILLVRESPAACAYYNLNKYFGANYMDKITFEALEFPLNVQSGLTGMITRVISQQSPVQAWEYTQEMMENMALRENVRVAYPNLSVRHNWRVIGPIFMIANMFRAVDAAKVETVSSQFPMWIACFVGCMYMFPWVNVLKPLRWVLDKITHKKISELEKVVAEVRKTFKMEEGISPNEFRTEAGTDSPSPSDDSYGISDFFDEVPPIPEIVSTPDPIPLPELVSGQEINNSIPLSLGGFSLNVTAGIASSVTLLWSSLKALSSSEYEIICSFVPFLMGIFSAPRLSAGAPMYQVLSNYVSFSLPFFRSIAKVVSEFPRGIAPIFSWRTESSDTMEFSDDWLQHSEKIFEKWSEYKDSQLGQAFIELMSFALVAPTVMDKCTSLEAAGFGSRVKMVKKIMKEENCSISGVLRSVCYVTRTFIEAIRTGHLSTCLDLKSEMLYVTCAEYDVLIANGTFHHAGLTERQIRDQYERLHRMLQTEIMCTHGLGRKVADERMIKVMTWRRRLDYFQKDGAPKEQPFCVYLYGIAGAGKSALVHNLSKILHNKMGWGDIEKLSTIVSGDKFASSCTSATTAILVDDAGNALLEKRKESVSQVAIDRVASITTPFLKADVDAKGSMLDCTKYVFWTSNTNDCGVAKETASYNSVIRRFGIQIEVIVNPEYLDEHGRLKREKMMAHAHELIPTYMTYQHYTMVFPPGSMVPVQVRKGQPMTALEFAQFIVYEQQEHFYAQTKAMERTNAYERAPKCDDCLMPTTLCSCTFQAIRDAELARLRTLIPGGSATTPIAIPLTSSSNSVDATSVITQQFATEADIVVGDPIEDDVQIPSITSLMQLRREQASQYAYSTWRRWFRYYYLNTHRPIVTSLWFHLSCLYEKIKLDLFAWYTVLDFGIRHLIPLGLCRMFLPEKGLFSRLKDAYVMLWVYETMELKMPYIHAFVFAFCRSGVRVSCIISLYAAYLRYKSYQGGLTYFVHLISFWAACLVLVSSFLIQYYVCRAMSSHPSIIREVVMKRLLVVSGAVAGLAWAYKLTPQIAAVLKQQWKTQGGVVTETRDIPIFEESEKQLKPKAVVRDWIAPLYDKGILQKTSSSMTEEQILPRIAKNLVILEYDDFGTKFRVHAMYLNSSLLLMPHHFWKPPSGSKDSMTVVARFRQKNGVNYERKITLCKNRSVYIDDKDTDIVIPVNSLGDKPSLIELFPLKSPEGTALMTWCHFDSTFTRLQTTAVEGRVGDDYDHVAISGGNRVVTHIKHGINFGTDTETYGGSCGSILLSNRGGVSIVGMYVAGLGNACRGLASTLTRADIERAEDVFRTKKIYMRPTERFDAVVEIGHNRVEVVPGIHPKNPVNFQEDLGVVVATVEKTFTPRAQTTPNIYSSECRRELRITDHFKAPDFNFNKAIQPLIARAWKPIPAPDADLLTRAVNDFCVVIPEAISNALEVVCEDGSQALIADRFLEIDEVINGIAGNPFFPPLNSGTSAGFPYNMLKRKVLDGRPEYWSLREPDYDFYCKAAERLANGVSTGSVFSCTLKSEPRSIEKEGARAFQAINLQGFLLVKRALQPLMSIITHSADLFETVLGVNALSPEWDRNIRPLFGDKLLSDEDYKNYDQSQVIELRTAAACVYREIAIALGWTPKMLNILEATCQEFLRPLINVNGVIISTDNLMPSGSNITAQLNGIANSIAQRVSFYKRVHHIPSFRSVVFQRNLGDDLIKCIIPEIAHLWTPTMTKEDLFEFGLVLTPGTKGETELKWKPPGTPAWFLKRETYYNEDLQCLVGVLHPKSCLRPFTMHEKLSVPPKDYMLQITDSLIRESFFKGRAEFDACQKCVFSMLDAIKLPKDFCRISWSYDQMLQFELEAYSHIPRSPCPENMSKTVSNEYLHFTKDSWIDEWKTEAGIDVEENVHWEVGESDMVSPEIVARVYAGEHIISLLALLKPFNNIGTATITETSGFSPIYQVSNSGTPTSWNLIFLSFFCVRGGINVLMSMYDQKIFLARRGDSLNYTALGAMGTEIIDGRVNPTAVITAPCYMTTRWFQVSGKQEVRYMPQYSIGPLDGVASKVLLSRAAAEDFSLLNYRGPPILTVPVTVQRRRLRSDDFNMDSDLHSSAPMWKTEAGSEVGVTTFAMSENTEESDTSPPAVRDPSVRIQDTVHAYNWLERPFPLATYSIPVETNISYPMKPFDWVKNSIVKAHLRGVSTMTVDLVVRLEVSASLQHSGMLMLSLLPMNTNMDFQYTTATTAGTLITYASRSNLPHATCRVGQGGYVDLDVPFVYPHDCLQVAKALGPTNDYNPVVYLDTLSPIQTTLGSTDSITVNVFVFAKTINLGGTTSWVTEAGSEPFSSKVSAAAGASMMMADVMSSVPTLALPFEVGGVVLNGVAGAARMFGHSRPISDSTTAVVPTGASSLSTFNTNLHGRSLALDKDQGISIDGVIGGLAEKNHMMISDIISRPFFLGNMAMTNLTPVYDSLAVLNVGPQLFVIDNGQLAMSGGGLCCTQFRNWYGSMHYKFDFVVPAGTGGILEILYEPYGNFPTELNITNNPSVRINLREKKSVTIKVNWMSDKGCLATILDEPQKTLNSPLASSYDDNMFNGQLVFRLVAPLTIPGTSSAVNMDVICWAWCDPKMIFWDYGPNALSGYIIPQADQTILAYGSDTYSELTNPVRYSPIPPQFPSSGTKPIGTSAPTTAHATPTTVPVPQPPVKQPTKVPIKSPIKVPTKAPVKTSGAPIRPPTAVPTVGKQPTVTCAPTSSTVNLVNIPAALGTCTFVAGSGTKWATPSPNGYVYLKTGTYAFVIPKANYLNGRSGTMVYRYYGSVTMNRIIGTSNIDIPCTGGVDVPQTFAGFTQLYASTPPPGYDFGYTTLNFSLKVEGTGYVRIDSFGTNIVQTTGITSPQTVLFSALWYTMGTDPTQITPTSAMYAGDDGVGTMCAEFPPGAQIGYPSQTLCAGMKSYPVVIVGEGTITQTTLSGSVPVFSGTTTLSSMLVTKTAGEDIPNFPPDCVAFKVGGAAGSVTAVRFIYVLPN